MPAVSGRTALNSDRMNLLVEFRHHVPRVLEVLNERRGIRCENLAAFLATDGKNLLNLPIVLHVFIDDRAIDAARLTLNAGHFLNSWRLREIVKVFVISNVQLVQDVHFSRSFMLMGNLVAMLLYLNAIKNTSIFFGNVEK